MSNGDKIKYFPEEGGADVDRDLTIITTEGLHDKTVITSIQALKTLIKKSGEERDVNWFLDRLRSFLPKDSLAEDDSLNGIAYSLFEMIEKHFNAYQYFDSNLAYFYDEDFAKNIDRNSAHLDNLYKIFEEWKSTLENIVKLVEQISIISNPNDIDYEFYGEIKVKKKGEKEDFDQKYFILLKITEQSTKKLLKFQKDFLNEDSENPIFTVGLDVFSDLKQVWKSYLLEIENYQFESTELKNYIELLSSNFEKILNLLAALISEKYYFYLTLDSVFKSFKAKDLLPQDIDLIFYLVNKIELASAHVSNDRQILGGRPVSLINKVFSKEEVVALRLLSLNFAIDDKEVGENFFRSYFSEFYKNIENYDLHKNEIRELRINIQNCVTLDKGVVDFLLERFDSYIDELSKIGINEAEESLNLSPKTNPLEAIKYDLHTLQAYASNIENTYSVNDLIEYSFENPPSNDYELDAFLRKIALLFYFVRSFEINDFYNLFYKLEGLSKNPALNLNPNLLSNIALIFINIIVSDGPIFNVVRKNLNKICKIVDDSETLELEVKRKSENILNYLKLIEINLRNLSKDFSYYNMIYRQLSFLYRDIRAPFEYVDVDVEEIYESAFDTQTWGNFAKLPRQVSGEKNPIFWQVEGPVAGETDCYNDYLPILSPKNGVLTELKIPLLRPFSWKGPSTEADRARYYLANERNYEYSPKSVRSGVRKWVFLTLGILGASFGSMKAYEYFSKSEKEVAIETNEEKPTEILANSVEVDKKIEIVYGDEELKKKYFETAELPVFSLNENDTFGYEILYKIKFLEDFKSLDSFIKWFKALDEEQRKDYNEVILKDLIYLYGKNIDGLDGLFDDLTKTQSISNMREKIKSLLS